MLDPQKHPTFRMLTPGRERQCSAETLKKKMTLGKKADFVILNGDPLSVYTRVLETHVEGRKVFDLDDPKDRLWAEGGFGAGHRRRASGCCFTK